MRQLLAVSGRRWQRSVALGAQGSPEASSGGIYVVRPTGLFGDDPNVTDEWLPSNHILSYRTRAPLHIGDEVEHSAVHNPSVLQSMLESLARLRADGRDVSELQMAWRAT